MTERGKKEKTMFCELIIFHAFLIKHGQIYNPAHSSLYIYIFARHRNSPTCSFREYSGAWD